LRSEVVGVFVESRFSDWCKLVVEKIRPKSDLHTARWLTLHFWEVVGGRAARGDRGGAASQPGKEVLNFNQVLFFES
jgi:hypothetical protein